MSDLDDIIRERLRKLRCDEQQAASTSGQNQASSIPNVPKKTNVEQVDDLLAKLNDEVAVDNVYSKDKFEIDAQIRRRLERLKEWELGPPRANFEIGSLKTVPDVVNAVLSRPDFQINALEDINDEDGDSGKMSADDSGTSSEDSDAPPNYCVFCKSEPSVVCVDCYKDSYCTKCFNEFHVPEDKHTTIKYVPKKKK